MQGALQRQCAMVRGRVDQGMYFLDLRHRRLYAVVGQNHWTDPRQGFLAALGDTFAVTGKVWRRLGSSAIAIQNVYPWRQQPPPRFRWWPWQWEWSVLLGCGILAALYGLAIVRLPSRLAVPGEHRLHIVMHLMVMATAVMMWWPVMGREAVERGLSPPGQMLYLFLLGTPMMAVAAMITFADHSLYEWYALAPRFMGMSAVDDQRLGGLIMWVPGGLFYWGAMSVIYFRWAAREARSEDPLIRAAVRS